MTEKKNLVGQKRSLSQKPQFIAGSALTVQVIEMILPIELSTSFLLCFIFYSGQFFLQF